MKKFINKKTLGILVSIVFIAIILHHTDMGKTVKSFEQIKPVWVVSIIPFFLFAFAARALRWRIFLADRGLKFKSLISSIFIGFSLNCILPARAGEIYRAYFFSKKENLNKTKVFTSVILERFFDGFVLFIVLLTAIYLVHSSALFLKIAFLAGLIFLGGLAFLLVLVKIQKNGTRRENIRLFFLKLNAKRPESVNRVFSVIDSFFEGLKALNSNSLLAKAFLMTFLIWSMEGTIMYLVIKGFGVNISYFGAFLVLAVTAFSSLIPAGPAAIGPYQWGYIIALAAFNVERELALAVSITNQFIIILLILSFGFYFMWKDHISINDREIKRELNWS